MLHSAVKKIHNTIQICLHSSKCFKTYVYSASVNAYVWFVVSPTTFLSKKKKVQFFLNCLDTLLARFTLGNFPCWALSESDSLCLRNSVEWVQIAYFRSRKLDLTANLSTVSDTAPLTLFHINPTNRVKHFIYIVIAAEI